MNRLTRTISSTFLVLAAGAAATAVRPLPLAAQDAFRWSGIVEEGKMIEIKGVRGSIRAARADGRAVEVTAVKFARRSDPDEVTIEVVEHEDGVTICAVYPSNERRPNECRPGSRGRMSTGNNDVEVEFVVRVPAGVHFAGRTVNGKIEAAGLDSDVEARTVNGSIDVSTSGFARATTVNGAIRAALGSTDRTRDLEFETVNGSITVELPANANAGLVAKTVNGSITSDFPLTIRGRISRKRLEGTIGSGGGRIVLATVNGSIALRKRA